MSIEEKLGEILLRQSELTQEQIFQALEMQRESKDAIGKILLDLKYIKEEDLLKALSEQLDIEYLEIIPEEDIDPDLIKDIHITFVKQNRVMPLNRKNNYLNVVTSDPVNLEAINDLKLMLGGNINLFITPSSIILDTINKAYDQSLTQADEVMDGLEDDELSNLEKDFEEVQDLLDVSDDAPIIRLVNSLISQAVKERVSDIHVEPFEKDLSVRFRVDGILVEKLKPHKRLQASIISRIKIMAGLNIAEKRLPQDGRIRIKIAGKDVDIRTSIVPTRHGERVVMRLLDRSAVLIDMDSLGLEGEIRKKVNELIHLNHGILLVTGPTGSGKTTTLYSALSTINSPTLNILTAEDPIEYELHGIGQMQVNHKIGLSFASCLRSFLRQDPDVILVGEIRDVDTAEIAIQASLTGHLVFSTLHTNDAPTAITRLIDMGVEPFLVSSSLVAVLAQRLCRRICVHCKEEYEPTDIELESVGLDRSKVTNKFYKGKGCPVCFNKGYQGRVGIFELLIIDDEIRQLVLKNMNSVSIKRRACEKGMLPLREDGVRKAMMGYTTLEEVLLVTQED